MEPEVGNFLNYEKSKMEQVYESYISSDNAIVEIDNVKYFKIIYKDFIKFCTGKKIVLLTLPVELFHGSSVNYISDENGTRYEVERPIHISFSIPIPEWYLNSLTCPIKGEVNIADIGDYVCLSE